MKFIDLFCGIGGFRIAAERAAERLGAVAECVFSCDIDPYVQEAYEANFGERPFGDIKDLDERRVPEHDLLFAGFPCQPFSIIGSGHGFEDARGTLFFDIARILNAKKPPAFVLENVKQLSSHQSGRTMEKILSILRDDLGYSAEFRVLNALNFGLPQKRERTIIVGMKGPWRFEWPEGGVPPVPLSELLEDDVPKKYFASRHIVEKRRKAHKPSCSPAIWHENKAGHISSYPWSCALRANASYNYLLVDGKRRLTPREMLRLQGFPDSFKLVVSDGQTRKQAGNAVPVPVIEAVLINLFKALPELLGDAGSVGPRRASKKEAC